MSCTVCGSTTSCNCYGTERRRCASNSCCQNTVQATPTPFYNCGSPCQESHQQKITIQEFFVDVNIQDSWNIPACGSSATVVANSLKSIVVGSYLWNPDYGYFEVSAFNAGTGQVTLINHCDDGNSSAGTNVPSCTNFTVTVPPVNTESSNVCVAIDFTAPDVGDCIDITLTTTTGLTVADTVQIGSGFYFVQELKPNAIITICNRGDGIAPGTPVIARDTNGDYQYCLTVVSVNPCDRDPAATGKVLVCNSELVQGLGNAGHNGDYVGCVNFSTGESQFLPLDSQEPVCTTLGDVLTIVSGTANYNVQVADSSGFTVGDIVAIGTVNQRFEVTAVPNATHVTGTFHPTPLLNATIAKDEYFCLLGCCEELRCASQGLRFTIPATFYNEPVGLDSGGAQSFEVVLDTALYTYTAPDDDTCINATYHVRAEINVTELLDYTFTAPNIPFVSGEIQAYWDNNIVGGRFNWSENVPANVSDAEYPATTQHAIWGLLQSAFFSINYHGGYIIADTLVGAGDTVNLVLNFKCIQPDDVDYRPDTIDAFLAYVVGNVVVTRVI